MASRKRTTGIGVGILTACALLGGCSPAANEYAERVMTWDGDFSQIELDVRDRAVSVVASDDDQARLICWESDREFYEVSENGDNLTILSTTEKEWTDYVGGKAPAEARQITLEVPQGELGALRIATTNEDITLGPLSIAEEVSLSSNGGDVIVDEVKCPTISLESKNGNVEGSIDGTYEDYAFSCSIKKGNSNLPEKKERVIGQKVCMG